MEVRVVFVSRLKVVELLLKFRVNCAAQENEGAVLFESVVDCLDNELWPFLVGKSRDARN